MMKLLRENPIVGGAVTFITVFVIGVALTIVLGLMVMGPASADDNHGGSMGAAMIWSFGIPASLFVSVASGVIVTVVLRSRSA